MNERVEARGRVADGTDGKVPALRLEGLVRWLKFNFVGGIGIFVQLAALTLFRAGLHLDYLLATGLAVETAVIHNFLWHERFTGVTGRRRTSGNRWLGSPSSTPPTARFRLSGICSLCGRWWAGSR